jgi:hypothetical protein
MSELNEINRRLAEGIPPSPKEIDLIIADIRRQRAIYEGGGKKARSQSDDTLDEARKVLRMILPPKKTMTRRF